MAEPSTEVSVVFLFTPENTEHPILSTDLTEFIKKNLSKLVLSTVFEEALSYKNKGILMQLVNFIHDQKMSTSFSSKNIEETLLSHQTIKSGWKAK